MTGLPAYTLAEAEAAIRSMLDRIDRAEVDHVDSFRLAGFAGILGQMLAWARSPSPPQHFFGENWHGPGLADVIADCERILVPYEKRESKQRRAA